MSKAHILAVDDEEDILEIIRFNLAREGYRVTCADSGEKALRLLQSDQPDLIVLDLMLPGVDGLDVCRTVKRAADTSKIPIIMLTARSEEADVVAGLELGADDYITKPFSARVLLARIKSVLRRKETDDVQPSALDFEDLIIYPEKHRVTVKGQPVELTATEFRILTTLSRRPGWVFSRDQIVDATQGTNAVVTSRSVDVHIVSLRRKLGDCGEYIETMRGVGYRFRDPHHA
jgi:two-component system phosphate regulon response regulator PhoB